MAVMNDAPPVPWSEIQGRYVSGETPAKLAETFASTGVTIAAIRKRVVRERWVMTPGRIPFEAEARTLKVVDRAIAKEVKKNLPAIKEAAKAAIARCDEKASAMAEEMIDKARLKLRDAEGKDLSSIATLGRTGVDVWRTTLGLNSTGGSGSTSSAVSISFVLKGNVTNVLGRSHETLPETTGPEQPAIDI